MAATPDGSSNSIGYSAAATVRSEAGTGAASASAAERCGRAGEEGKEIEARDGATCITTAAVAAACRACPSVMKTSNIYLVVPGRSDCTCPALACLSLTRDLAAADCNGFRGGQNTWSRWL